MPEQVVGRNPVIELLRSGSRQIEKIWIAAGSNDARIRQIIAMAKQNGVRYQRCTRRHLDILEPTTPHQGVIAVVSGTRYVEVPAILEQLQRKDGPALLLMLDSIQDPRNLGAILRTADAASVDAVFIPKNQAVGMTAAVHKTSAGASEYVPIAKVTNVARTLEKLKSAQVWVVGAADDAALPWTEADFTVPICLVLGNEATGIRRLVKQKCDYLVHLPMLGRIESLNVSVAAGILLYEVLRQRNVKRSPPPSGSQKYRPR